MNELNEYQTYATLLTIIVVMFTEDYTAATVTNCEINKKLIRR